MPAPITRCVSLSKISLVVPSVRATEIALPLAAQGKLAFSISMPLALASGAGSASQRAIGTGVLGGMITGTGLAVFFVPVFFVVVRGYFKGSERQRRMHAHEMPQDLPAGASAGDQV